MDLELIIEIHSNDLQEFYRVLITDGIQASRVSVSCVGHSAL